MALHTKILLGLLVGAVAGVGANTVLGGDHTVVEVLNHYVAGPVGQVFLRLLFMIVMPLVFASIALGVTGIGDVRRVTNRIVRRRLMKSFFAPRSLWCTGCSIHQA